MNTLQERLLKFISYQDDFVELDTILKQTFCASKKKEYILLALQTLEKEEKILRSTDNQYILNCSDIYIGIITINENGNGTISFGEQTIQIAKEYLNNAQDGDRVVLSFDYQDNGEIDLQSAEVAKIIDQSDQKIIIELVNNYDVLEPRIFPTMKPINIQIDQEMLNKSIGGDRLIVTPINEFINGKQKVIINESLGNKKDPTIQVQRILEKYGRGKKWSKEAMEQAYQIALTKPEDYSKGRKDYTKLPITFFSLDGSKTQDRDDCIGIYQKPNGNYVSIVPVADPSAFIKPGTPLWKEALERGYTDYVGDYSDPMIPRILTDGILSLNPGVLRPAFVSEVEINQDGEIVNIEYHQGIIKSQAALTFEKANDYYDKGIIHHGYQPFIETLKTLKKVSSSLKQRRYNLGAYEISDMKPNVTRTEDGSVLDYDFTTKGTSENILKNFMLLHGLAAANYLKLPSPFRCHQAQNPELLEQAIIELIGSGIIEDPHFDYQTVTNEEIRNFLNRIKNPRNKKIAEQRILKSSPAAFLTVEGEIGHNALGEEKITQFTSPDRRGDDLLVQHNIKLQESGHLDDIDLDEYAQIMEAYCYRLNEQEQRVKKIQREYDAIEAIEYIAKHFDEKYTATVEYINRNFIIIRTHNNIQGILRTEDIFGEKFYYDEERKILISKKNKIRIKLGSTIIVTPLCINTEEITKDNNIPISFQIEYEDVLTLRKK